MSANTPKDYRATARRMLRGDNFKVPSNASVKVNEHHGGALVRVSMWIDDYEVAITKQIEVET